MSVSPHGPVPSRRALLGAAVWSVPVISVVTAAPAIAVSMAVSIRRVAPTATTFSVSDLTSTRDLTVAVTDSAGVRASEAVTFLVSPGDAGWVTFAPTGTGSAVVVTNPNGVASVTLQYLDTHPPVGSTATIYAQAGSASVAWTVTYLGSRPSVVAAGYLHTVLLRGDGTARACGEGGMGRLGNGGADSSAVPVVVSAGAVPPGVALTAITAGQYHNLALGSDGKAYAWGYNGGGQLGNGTQVNSSVPVAVRAGAVPTGVRLTAVAGFTHSLALGSDGRLYAWGGLPGTGTSSSVPVAVAAGAVPAGVTHVAVAAGGFYSLALGSDGKAYAWGLNSSGQLGDGGTADSAVPVAVSAGAVPPGVTFTAIAAGVYHCVALGSDGKAYAWGAGGDGRLGNGDTANSSVPVAVSAGAVPAGVSLVAVAAGGAFSVALGSDGKAYGWGSGTSGTLGAGNTIGSTTASTVPVAAHAGAIPDGVRLTAIAAGTSHVVARGSDGAVYAWGHGASGQLGYGGSTNAYVPVAVSIAADPWK